MDDFIWWIVKCPEWELNVAIFVCITFIIFIILSILRGIKIWEKTDTENQHLGTVNHAQEKSEGGINQDFVAKSVKENNTRKQ